MDSFDKPFTVGARLCEQPPECPPACFDPVADCPIHPPPPPQCITDNARNESEALSSMVLSWYMGGYHTGFYQGFKLIQCGKLCPPPDSTIPPPPPPQCITDNARNEAEALSSMLMSWYIGGYYTGFYQGIKQASKNCCS